MHTPTQPLQPTLFFQGELPKEVTLCSSDTMQSPLDPHPPGVQGS